MQAGAMVWLVHRKCMTHLANNGPKCQILQLLQSSHYIFVTLFLNK